MSPMLHAYETMNMKLSCHASGAKFITDLLVYHTYNHMVLGLASFPGPAQLCSLAIQKSGRGPGMIYHMHDVEGSEKVERT